MTTDPFSKDEGKHSPDQEAPEPELQPETLRLKDQLSVERWERVVERALERVEVLEATAKRREEHGESWRRSLQTVAPEVDWSTYLHWHRRAEQRQGAPWERQLDERVAPGPYRLTPEMRAAACLLRRAKPTMGSAEAQRHLEEQFGAEQGTASATSLKRIWKAAGLAQRKGRPAPAAARDKPAGVQGVQEEGWGDRSNGVEMFHGGGALALVAAAAAETKVAEELAAAVLQRARAVVAAEVAAAEAAAAEAVAAEAVAVLLPEPTGRDEAGRFTAAYNRAIRGQSDSDPRRRPDAQKRHGRPLSTLALVNSRPEVMAQKLLAMGLTPLLTEKRGFDGLRGPNGDWLGVLRGTAYVDATQDPFWTRLFARSGKVSRVGRVMPCITRVALMGGAGVPLWVETRAGTVSLEKEFLSTLDRIEQGAKRLQTGEWQRYRERDLVRETRVLLHGEGAPEGGLELRGVEMQRDGSRNPTTTLFTTNAPPGELGTADVPTAYLSRWPHQEQRFREGRHGLGMDRSHGYGGECVTHVAVATQQDQALKRTERPRTTYAG